MTTVKISQLPAILGADAATTDVLPIVDVSGNVTNKITREEFFKNIQSDVEIADKIVHSGDTNTAIRFPAADTVTVETSGAERLRITDTGNVGIGGTPSVLLHARSDTAQIRASNAANSVYSYMLRDGLYSVGTQMYVYNVSNNPISFHTNDTERMRIDASGNLGLGVTPSAWSQGRAIEVVNSGYGFWNGTNSIYSIANAYFNSGFKYANTGQQASHYYQFQGQHVWSTAPSGTAGNAITFTQAMTLNASGNLGIGATSPSKKLHLAGTAGSSAILLAKTDSGASTLGQIGFSTVNGTVAGIDATAVTDSNNGALRFWTTGGSPQSDVTSLSERARIDASGNLLVGTTANPNTAKIHIGPTASNGISIESNSTSVVMSQMLFRNPNGVVGSITTNGSSTAYNTTSDYRLKENVQPMQDALTKIAQLNPVTYTWKADGSAGQGFIAHELQAVVPDCVTGEKDAVDAEGKPKYQGVDTSFLVATLVAAIKELKAEVDSLRAQLNP